MRAFIVLAATLAACTSSSGSPSSPASGSVRDRLAAPTQLVIAPAPDAGMLGAEHDTAGGWVSGSAAVSIADGELVASLDGSGQLAAGSFELAFDPIDVPASVFGSPAQLSDVALALAAPVDAPIQWSDANDATTAIPLVLELSWSLTVNGVTTPLGSQQLPAIPLVAMLAGDGDHVTATLALDATGELWSWADLLKLTALDVAADAATADQ